MATPARARLVATELPGRVEAEADLRSRLYGERRCYAAMVTVQRLELVQRHFGVAAGELCLATVAARLARILQCRDRLYRWSGATLILLLDRPTALKAVSSELRECLRSLSLVRVENSALRVECGRTLFPLEDFTSPASLLRKIELSVATVHSA